MDLIEFFCGKTPPRNHTISIKEMLLCWLDVKRPCVLYQNGEESSEQTRVSSQSEQTKVSRQGLRMLSHHFAVSCS